MIPTKIKYYGKDNEVLTMLKKLEKENQIPFDYFNSNTSKIDFIYEGSGNSGYRGSQAVKEGLLFLINETIPGERKWNTEK